MFKWSAKNAAFFPSSSIDIYVAAGWDLGDAVDIENDVYLSFQSQPYPNAVIGATADGRPTWIDAPKPEPVNATRVSRAQGKKQLIAANLYDSAKLWVDNPSTPETARIGFYDEEYWVITDEFVQLYKVKAGLTDAQLQDLFNSAAAR